MNMNFLKKDVFYLLCLSFVFVVLAIFVSPRLTNIIVDLGRELYFPQLMLEGKLLYKDIFNLFGPLAYQINAFLYKLFGIKVLTLQIAGLVNSFFIMCLLYFISRLFLCKKLSFLIVLYLLCVGVFSNDLFNFVFPYSYSWVYALSSFLASSLCLLLAVKYPNLKNKAMVLAYLFFGISLTSKYDFMLYGIILVGYTFLLKPTKKACVYSILAFLSVPVISCLNLLLQGVTIQDFQTNAMYVKNYIVSEPLREFYSKTVGTFFAKGLYSQKDMSKFFNDMFWLVAFVITTYFANIKLCGKLRCIANVAIAFFGIFSVMYISDLLSAFFFLGYIVFGMLCYYLMKAYKSRVLTIDFVRHDMLLLLILISLTGLSKTFFRINCFAYGSSGFLLGLITLIAFVVYIFSTDSDAKIKSTFMIEKSVLINVVSVVLIILIGCYVHTNYIAIKSKVAIETPKGKIYDDAIVIEQLRQFFEYADKNISKKESLLVIPEGVMVNFLMDYDLKLYEYYCLLPPHIDAFGKEKILNDIKNERVENIVLFNRGTEEYGRIDVDFFIEDFLKDYNLEKMFVDIFQIYVYKRK